MKNLKWKLDLSFNKEEEKPDTKLIFQNNLIAAIQLRFKDGIGVEFQRRLYKILDKLEKAESDYLELEDAEFELIKDAFEGAKFPPSMNKILNQIYDNIDEAKK